MNSVRNVGPRKLLVTAMLMIGLAASLPAYSAGETVEVVKSPYCDCCGKWVEHMRKAGFRMNVTEVDDVIAQRESLHMPPSVASCHTSKVGKYVLEGHIPAEDIQRLLTEQPAALGLAVPSMPPGSPGMEGPQSIPYDTLLVKKDGSTSVFAKH
jgi:hypothetical protein